MPDLELEEMTAASTADGTELLYAVQGGADRKMTVAQVNASRQPLDPTLTALSGLDADPGYVYQSSVDTFIKRMPTAADMAALRTFVRPPGTVGSAGGFYQQNLFEIAVNTPDALCGEVTVNVKITDTDTSKAGSYFYKAVFLIHRYISGTPFGASDVPAGLVKSAYFGTSGTSMGVVQLTVGSAATSSITFLIQPLGFTSPTVTITAVLVLPGTNAVSLAP